MRRVETQPNLHPLRPEPNPSEEKHVIVCGLGRFGLRIVSTLRKQNVPVVVITDKETRADRKARALQEGAYLVEGDFRFPDVLLAARVHEARALILASSSDSANLECALDVGRDYPSVRVVMRLDADAVAGRLAADFGIAAVLSPPVLAAHAFTIAALHPAPPGPIHRASGHTVPASRSRLPRRLVTRVATRGNLLPRVFPGALILLLFALFGLGVSVFEHTLKLSWVDATYFTATIVSTVGFGDYNLHDQPAWVKLFGVVMMFGGVTLIAALSSLLTNFFLSGAATQMQAEQYASRMRDHVILCGLGSVGFEVAEDLLDEKVKLVVVDATPDDAHARNLSARVPLIVGDATQPDVLRRAGVGRARAVIAAVSSDAVNLEIGLIAQSLVEEFRPSRPLRIVLRCFDADLAQRINARSDAYTLLSSAEIAAPIFVQTALGDGPQTKEV